MATVSAMLVLSRLRRGEQGEFESLIKKRQIPKGKRKKLMMLMIALAIVVNLREIGLFGSDPELMPGSQWLAMSSQKNSGIKTSTCLKEPFFTW